MRRLVKTSAPGVGYAVTLATVSSSSAQPTAGFVGLTARSTGSTPTPQPRVENLRAGQHECYDRIVIDLGADPQGRPASSHRLSGEVCVIGVLDIETGGTIPIAGGAILSIQVNAPGSRRPTKPRMTRMIASMP